MTIKLGILGAGGRMGRAIRKRLAGDTDFTLVACGVRPGTPAGKKPEGAAHVTDSAEEVFRLSDLVIDFSVAGAAAAHARLAVLEGTPLLAGTTGLAQEAKTELQKAGQSVPILYAPNTSGGVAAVRHAAREILLALGPDTPVDILDIHHAGKRDAPSGTALMLEEVLKEAGAQSVEIESRREGDVPGTHRIRFRGAGETIVLEHQAASRDLFAAGALRAARWLAGQKKPGYYTMQDVIGGTD